MSSNSVNNVLFDTSDEEEKMEDTTTPQKKYITLTGSQPKKRIRVKPKLSKEAIARRNQTRNATAKARQQKDNATTSDNTFHHTETPSPNSKNGSHKSNDKTQLEEIKIIMMMLGRISVGKTTFLKALEMNYELEQQGIADEDKYNEALKKLQKDMSNETYKVTLGVETMSFSRVISGYKCNFFAWDTAGVEKKGLLIPSMTKTVLNSMNIFYLAFEIPTYEKIDDFPQTICMLKELMSSAQCSSEKTMVFFIGTKLDCARKSLSAYPEIILYEMFDIYDQSITNRSGMSSYEKQLYSQLQYLYVNLTSPNIQTFCSFISCIPEWLNIIETLSFTTSVYLNKLKSEGTIIVNSSTNGSNNEFVEGRVYTGFGDRQKINTLTLGQTHKTSGKKASTCCPS